MVPGYIELCRSGELEKRAYALEARLASCDICPRECHVNRLQNEMGYCHSGYLPIVSVVCAHQGEEPAISGTRGSGAVFFSNCNMRCAYCQNYQISQNWKTQNSRKARSMPWSIRNSGTWERRLRSSKGVKKRERRRRKRERRPNESNCT